MRADIYKAKRLLKPTSTKDQLNKLRDQVDKFIAVCDDSEEFAVYVDDEGRRHVLGLAKEAAATYLLLCSVVAAMDHASLNNMIRYTEEALALNVRHLEDTT